MRPADWFLVELPSDPTPGDAFGIRGLAAKYAEIATIAGDASDGVTRARSSGAASAWIGEAADVFHDKSHRMPGELAKANDSYSIVAEALRAWADALDDAQAQADRGLQQAREAHADLVSAHAVLAGAQTSWSTVHAQQLSYRRLQKDYASVPPPPNVTVPTDAELRSADRGVQQALSAIAAANSRIAEANTRLDAAKALVAEAKSRRDDAERAVVHTISQAEDHAVKPSSVWEAIQDSAAWQTVVQIATVVLTIVSIVAIFVGGPLVWAIILAATILLVVNALLSIAQGKDAWGELALLAVGLIPGGRLLGLATKGVEVVGRMGVAGEHLAAGIGAVTGAVRNGTNVVTRVVDLAGARIADLATAVPGGVLKALHSGSADKAVLNSILKRDYANLADVNAKNLQLRPNEGFQFNCTRCAIATDHTLAGAPSAAMPLLDEARSAPISVISDHFGMPFSEFKPVASYDAVVQGMREAGEGAQGIVYLARPGGRGGHVFNVVFDHNGIVFLEGQNGKFATLENFTSLRLLITRTGAS